MDTYSKSDPSPSEQTVGIGGTIREAAAILKSAQQGLVPVIGVNGAVIGVVGDDDIRRWLGDGRSLAEPLSSVIEGVPILAGEGEQKSAVVERMRVANQSCLPIVDAKGQFVRLGYMDRPTVPNCIPCLEGREQEYAAEAIAGGWLAVGPFIQRFEGAIAAFTGAAHAVAVINGTAALQLALVCAGVKPGDLVLLPTLTFAATANAVRHCGATPMFFDVEPVSWGIDAGQLARYLERDCVAKAGGLADGTSGARIGAVIPVHLYGHPVDLDPIVALAERYGIPLIEDGAEALGARYKERRVGSLHRVCCLSFNGNKIITGGNGGMILTDDAGFARRARYLASQARDDATEFVHGDIGYNYRLPNLNAAVALAQAEKLEEFLGRKRRIVERYAARFEATPGIGMWREAPWATSSCWMAILSVDEQRHPGAIAKLRRFLPMRGIEARPVWQPLHRQKPFAAAPHAPIEVAERLYRTSLCLPCSAGLTAAELDCVAQTIDAFFALQAL